MLNILAYPIMEVGTWNKMTFTEADLQEIADNYHELEKNYQVPLKLGHNDEQPMTDGMPALGWVKNVRRVGEQLLADFIDIPSVIVQLIEKNKYRSVSIELLMGLKLGKKAYKYILDAVAILGADKPAVYTLPDLNLYLAKRSLAYDEGGQRVRFERQAQEVKFINHKDTGVSMDEEAIKKLVAAAVDPLNARLDASETKLTEYRTKFSAEEDRRIKAESELKEIKARAEAKDNEDKKDKIRLARVAATALLEEAVKAKHITPVQRDSALVMFGVDNDEQVLKLDLTKVKSFFDLEVKQAKDKKTFKKDDSSTADGNSNEDPDRVHKDVFKEVDRRARFAMAKHGLKTYKEGVHFVWQSDPELAKEYLATDPPVRAAAGGN